MIKVSINGTPYEKFESISLSRSIDDSTGVFSLVTTSIEPGSFPIKRGDVVTITVNDISKLYGFVDEITVTGDNNGHTITASGRDNTCDLIDSSVPDAAKVIEEQISLKAMCEKVISALGTQLKVIDDSGQTNIFTEDDLQAAESGDGAMEYLQSYSRKKQVFLIPSGDGKLVIYRPGADNATTELIHKFNSNENNVKAYTLRQSQQSRFNQYIVRSQDNIGFFDDASYTTEGTNRNGVVTDSSIRTGRYLEVVAEENMEDAECLERAKEEANVRRARSTVYECTVQGFTMNDGTPWDIGQTATVKDEICGLNGSFIIRAVNYALNITEGSQTRITCAPVDAYKVQAVETVGDRRKSSVSFANDTPPAQVRSNR